MATITFINGETKPIDSVKALKMHLILKGQRPGTPEQYKFLETVERIDFKAKRYERPIRRDIDPGRLPYAD